jgi:hypothetical protein
MKFLRFSEVILESDLRNNQEVSPLSAEYKRVLVIRGPFHKQARLPIVFHRFKVFCFMQHNRSCMTDGGIRCDAVTRVVFCALNERSILFTYNQFCLSCVTFWVVLRRMVFNSRRFGTLCLFHLDRQVDAK